VWDYLVYSWEALDKPIAIWRTSPSSFLMSAFSIRFPIKEPQKL
jgi:hypothetical protein